MSSAARELKRSHDPDDKRTGETEDEDHGSSSARIPLWLPRVYGCGDVVGRWCAWRPERTNPRLSRIRSCLDRFGLVDAARGGTRFDSMPARGSLGVC